MSKKSLLYFIGEGFHHQITLKKYGPPGRMVNVEELPLKLTPLTEEELRFMVDAVLKEAAKNYLEQDEND